MARFGKWRSLAARCVRDAEVAGSNPAFPTRNRPFRSDYSVIRGVYRPYLRSTSVENPELASSPYSATLGVDIYGVLWKDRATARAGPVRDRHAARRQVATVP